MLVELRVSFIFLIEVVASFHAFLFDSRNPLHFVLVGRNEAELQVTRTSIETARQFWGSAVETTIDMKVMDLSDVASLATNAESMFDSPLAENPNRFSKIYFINNAGTMAPLLCAFVLIFAHFCRF